MTKVVKIKDISIGGGNNVAVQSMTNCDTLNSDAVKEQITRLQNAKCGIIRLAVENQKAVDACRQYLDFSKVPLVADIHFDYRLAIACCDAGFPKIRINPSNIGSKENLKEIVAACKKNKTVMRIGINAGSLEKDLLAKHGVSAKSLVLSAMRSVSVIENMGYEDLVVSVKASSVKMTIEANRLLSQTCNYPLHIGVTESGANGVIKSAIGIGALLNDSIGDTVRVSLTADPVEEVRVARDILKAVGRLSHCEVISCPTCSRCKYDLKFVADEIGGFTRDIDKDFKVAVMGCSVNGPGEAAEADLGVAGAGKNAVIFKKGIVIKTVEISEVIPVLKSMISEMLS